MKSAGIVNILRLDGQTTDVFNKVGALSEFACIKTAVTPWQVGFDVCLFLCFVGGHLKSDGDHY